MNVNSFLGKALSLIHINELRKHGYKGIEMEYVKKIHRVRINYWDTVNE